MTLESTFHAVEKAGMGEVEERPTWQRQKPQFSHNQEQLHAPVWTRESADKLDALLPPLPNRTTVFLTSHPMKKSHSNFLAVDLPVEIHHVALNGQISIAAERRFVADVGDRAPPFAADEGERDVNTGGG